jgi:hypothetical protein
MLDTVLGKEGTESISGFRHDLPLTDFVTDFHTTSTSDW